MCNSYRDTGGSRRPSSGGGRQARSIAHTDSDDYSILEGKYVSSKTDEHDIGVESLLGSAHRVSAVEARKCGIISTLLGRHGR